MEHSNSHSNPVIGMIISVITYITGLTASTWDISPTAIHWMQAGAFSAAMLSGLITLLNYWEIKWNPFKKKAK